MTPTLTAGSLFTGYAGLDKAIEEVFGVKTAWVSDIDPGACKVLAHRYPGVPNLGDVTKVDWSTVPRVYVLGGGFPCQDVSGAGRQAGLVEGTRSGLWHEFARAIRELRPVHVVIENVRGLMSARGAMPIGEHLAAEATRDACDHLLTWIESRLAYAVRQGRIDDAQRLVTRRARTMGCRKRAVARARRHERRLVRAIGTVLGTLADLGYDAQWRCIRASDVGAPHERFRVFILATDTTRQPAAVPTDLGHERPGRARDGWTGPAHGGLAPVALLQTPSVADVTGGHEHRLGARSDELLLNGQVKTLFPTPTTQDAANDGGPSQYDRNSLPLNTLIKTLPTPTTQNAHGNETNGRGEDLLPGAVRNLLPTPAVNDMGKAYTPEQWDAWTDKMKAAHGNGNGHGKSLEIEAARLFPTPVTDPVSHNGHGRNLGTEARLLPTPRTGDGDKGGPNQRGSSGDLMMPSAVLHDFGQYAAAVRRWEDVSGMPAPAPTEPTGKDGAHRLSPRFTEWMMGQAAGWITDVPGITRNEALKLCGNGVVTQQAIAALTEMLIYLAVAA
jgi:DNA (cytosine-5)-methyltransferase 1